MLRFAVRVTLAALLLTGSAACTGPAHTDEVTSPFEACPTSSGSALAGSAPDPALASAAGAIEVSVACFTGGAPVALGRLGRPAVLNLWASSCAPCRKELPEFQRLAHEVGDRVAVIGVVTNDTRTAAASLAVDLGITFPTVFDRDGVLQKATSPAVLPVTLFVDGRGVVRHTDTSGALTLAKLEALTATHLGVVLR